MPRIPSPHALRALRAVVGFSPARCQHPPSYLFQSHSLPTPTNSINSLQPHYRLLSTTSRLTAERKPPPGPSIPTSTAPSTRDRGPASTEDTQTDFSTMDVLGNSPIPATTIEACLSSSFHLNNGLKTPPGTGILLLSGEVLTWKPWLARSPTAGPSSMVTSTGVWEVDDERAWAALEVLWPRPDLLILGTGKRVLPVGKGTRERLAGLGFRLDVQDTRNAAAEFNLLCRERGTGEIGAALLPVGWDLATTGKVT